MEQTFLGGRVKVLVGDLTREAVDAIVNAANRSLMGGGGVDGAIHLHGGPAILEECRQLRKTDWPDGLPTGQVALTTAGNLPARYVIHTVGPIYGEEQGREAELLAACYRHALELAGQHQLSRIAFPAISTGIYGYPLAEAARVSSQAIRAALDLLPQIKEVRLVFFTAADADAFLQNQELGE